MSCLFNCLRSSSYEPSKAVVAPAPQPVPPTLAAVSTPTSNTASKASAVSVVIIAPTAGGTWSQPPLPNSHEFYIKQVACDWETRRIARELRDENKRVQFAAEGKKVAEKANAALPFANASKKRSQLYPGATLPIPVAAQAALRSFALTNQSSVTLT